MIDKKTAILRIDPQQLDQLFASDDRPKAKTNIIAKGLPASLWGCSWKGCIHGK